MDDVELSRKILKREIAEIMTGEKQCPIFRVVWERGIENMKIAYVVFDRKRFLELCEQEYDLEMKELFNKYPECCEFVICYGEGKSKGCYVHIEVERRKWFESRTFKSLQNYVRKHYYRNTEYKKFEKVGG